MLAYLVIREGSKWTDVYRLVPGESVTIGRAPTNHIVTKDERCSRHHAEIFLNEDQWTLRDLESRNGTAIGDKTVRGDYGLQPSDVIRIGQTQLKFVVDLSTVFPDSSSITRRNGNDGDDEATVTTGGWATDDSSVLAVEEPTKITHRTDQTKFLIPRDPSDGDSAVPKVGRAATTLCRLAFELAKATDLNQIAEVALAGMCEATQVDSGGVLLLPSDFRGEATGASLELIASRTQAEHRYHRVSNFLATTVMLDGEAVLARNVMDDSVLGGRDSQGDILASSVIVAPIRRGRKILGLVHLYSTTEEAVPDQDDLEFTLAVADTVAVALDNLNRRMQLTDDLNHIRVEAQQLRQRLGVTSEIIGGSSAMAKVHQEIERAAPSRATVLIRGESGVGKELVARGVHFASPRGKGPFVCLNCAALSETLLESELFGHERGAFTGATDRKIGKFEAADKGTLRLDEIGEMSQSIQAKFLRVLEGHPFERIGGAKPIKVDVRVIAATNRDLEKDVAEGAFRRDLYFRLHVVEIVVPGLRKRPEDIPDLAHFFLHRFNEETGRRIKGFRMEALNALKQYRWPGNVRELKNVIERAVVLARGDMIEMDDLTLSNLATAGDSVDVSAVKGPDQDELISLTEMERRHILNVLKNTGWNKSRTAQILGIERSTLDRKIRRYDLRGESPGRE